MDIKGTNNPSFEGAKLSTDFVQSSIAHFSPDQSKKNMQLSNANVMDVNQYEFTGERAQERKDGMKAVQECVKQAGLTLEEIKDLRNAKLADNYAEGKLNLVQQAIAEARFEKMAIDNPKLLEKIGSVEGVVNHINQKAYENNGLHQEVKNAALCIAKNAP